MQVTQEALHRWLQWPIAPSPADIVTVRKHVALSQTKAARCVHVNLRTWQKWEKGESEMHPAFWELFLRKCVEHKAQAAHLDSIPLPTSSLLGH